jgi:hypothetical protein
MVIGHAPSPGIWIRPSEKSPWENQRLHHRAAEASGEALRYRPLAVFS